MKLLNFKWDWATGAWRNEQIQTLISMHIFAINNWIILESVSQSSTLRSLEAVQRFQPYPPMPTIVPALPWPPWEGTEDSGGRALYRQTLHVRGFWGRRAGWLWWTKTNSATYWPWILENFSEFLFPHTGKFALRNKSTVRRIYKCSSSSSLLESHVTYKFGSGRHCDFGPFWYFSRHGLSDCAS